MKQLPIYALLFGLIASVAMAQQPSPLDQAMKAQLGELTFNNTILITEMKRLSEENAKLKAELEAAKKEKGDAK